jgi:hypothetical protein
MKPEHVVLAAVALGLGACVETTETAGTAGGMSGDSMTRAAEVSCLASADDFAPGGGAFVVSAEYSEANTLVIVADQAGDQYRCLSSNDGVVAEFQPM